MKRKFYSVLYVAIFALLMSGCSMSEIADGSRSAVKGYEKETVEVDICQSDKQTLRCETGRWFGLCRRT